MDKKVNTVLASLLPLDTEVVKDDGKWYAVTLGDIIDDEEEKKCVYYIAELEDMPKPDIECFIDSVGEHMNENCEDRFDRNNESLLPLNDVMKVVFDKWRE